MKRCSQNTVKQNKHNLQWTQNLGKVLLRPKVLRLNQWKKVTQCENVFAEVHKVYISWPVCVAW